MKFKSPLLPLTYALVAIGLFFISVSSLSEASSLGDKFFFLKKQLIWTLAGTISLVLASKVQLKLIKKSALAFFIITTVTLVLVFLPGFQHQALGAKRWLDLKLITIQPTEFFKLAIIILFSRLFQKTSHQQIKTLLIYLIPPLILIIAQPNLSATILITAICLTLYYLSGSKLSSLFSFCLFAALISTLLILTSPYRSARLKTLINPQTDKQDSYHSHQILLALSSGGWLGKGFGSSDQKYQFLPKISTDSILAVIGEETGFLGLTLVFLLYLSLANYLLKLSKIISDPFDSLFLSGLAAWIAFQSLINIAAIVALIPLTGVPLPFISYGGSALLSLLTGIGLARNIEKKHHGLIYSSYDNKNRRHHRSSPHSRPRAHQATSGR